jgi:hypothetical protein
MEPADDRMELVHAGQALGVAADVDHAGVPAAGEDDEPRPVTLAISAWSSRISGSGSQLPPRQAWWMGNPFSKPVTRSTSPVISTDRSYRNDGCRGEPLAGSLQRFRRDVHGNHARCQTGSGRGVRQGRRRGPAGAGRRIRDLRDPDADGDPRRDHPLCAARRAAGAGAGAADRKTRELDMDEGRASVAERGAPVPSGGA